MAIITLQEALTKMSNGHPFDLTFVKADRSRDTGGQIRREVQCTQLGIDFRNQIRRIKLRSGRIRNVHIRLITEFNGAKVVY